VNALTTRENPCRYCVGAQTDAEAGVEAGAMGVLTGPDDPLTIWLVGHAGLRRRVQATRSKSGMLR
jgi:hypothetical protein